MATISNEWYQQRERERQQAAAALAKVEVPAQAPVQPDSNADSPLAASPTSPQVDSTSSAKPQAAIAGRVTELTKVELPASAPVTNSELEPGEVAEARRTAVIPEPPIAELSEQMVRDPQAFTAWLMNLGSEHAVAQRSAHEFDFAAAADGKQISLKARQLIAFQAITEGKSLTAAAKEAGVSRMSVHRWMKHDATFQAALRRHKDESLSSAREQLQAGVEDAAQNLRHAVRQGHLTASIHLLRGLGLLGERKGNEEQPRQRVKVSSRAAAALEERLGQLLSALAQEPRVRGALAEEKEKPATDAQSDMTGSPATDDPAVAQGTAPAQA